MLAQKDRLEMRVKDGRERVEKARSRILEEEASIDALDLELGRV